MSNENVSTKKPEFNKFQAAVWPIHGFEMKKFLPMSLMMFCILFIYTLVRDLKDTLLVTRATCGGVECLSAAKLLVLVFAFLSVIVFAKLVNKFSMQKVFYIVVGFFLGFYALFGFVLYPLAPQLHMSKDAILNLQAQIPFLRAFWPVFGNWTYSLFYILSELWGSLVISALFWQFANQTTKKSEVKRFYGLFACIGNAGLIFSGLLVKYLAGVAKANIKSGNLDAFRGNVQTQMLFVLGVGVVLIAIYTYINKVVLTDSRFYDPADIKVKKKKPKMGIGESLKFIFTSKYLLLIAVLVISYGIGINLSECVWKDQMKLLLPDANDYNSMMGTLSITTGIVTIIVSILSSNILRRCKWKTAALITPLILLTLGAVFFGAVLYENHAGLNAKIFGIGILNIAVVVGLIQDALSKGVKYSLFDSTKQMAYLPLDEESKTKGQAAVEVIAGRLGKAGGATIQQILIGIMTAATLTSMAGTIGAIVLVIVGLWIASVCSLSKKYEAKVAENAKAEAAAAAVATEEKVAETVEK